MSLHAGDARFTLGMVADVAAMLRRHGYSTPEPGTADFSEFELELYRLLYEWTSIGQAPQPTRADR